MINFLIYLHGYIHWLSKFQHYLNNHSIQKNEGTKVPPLLFIIYYFPDTFDTIQCSL